jgi:ferredoxin
MTITGLPELSPDGRARTHALAGLGRSQVTPTAIVEFVSRGRCLIIGNVDEALGMARQLHGQLECVVAEPGDRAPQTGLDLGVRIVRGGRPLIRGALGDFQVALANGGAQQALGALLTPPVESFDLVVDLCSPPLLKQAMKPLGYYAPGGDPEARQALVQVLPDMRGEFEKPRYFNYNPEICAHGRSGKRGCTRCIDVCPAEAIISVGEKVQVNPFLCQGGGACAMVCPSGAMTYAYPVAGELLDALRRLLHDFHAEGGRSPCLLLYDESALPALDDGLAADMPERVLPVAVEEIGSVGMEVWLASLAYGADAVVMLTSDQTPPQVIEAMQEQLAITRALLAGMGYAGDRVGLVNANQPQAARDALGKLPDAATQRAATFVAPAAEKRGTLRLAVQHLYVHAPAPKRSVPLPANAPFGEVRVDASACTLCMSCVSCCPTHALQDGRGLPQLNFREWNCVQCGLCERTCPEDAITLSARFLYDQEAREQPRVLHEEQPVCCVSCGKPFATRSMLDTLQRKLEGHWMFKTEEARKRLLMCEDCRVRDMFAAERQHKGA